MKLKLLILDFDDTLFPTSVYRQDPNIEKDKINNIDELVCQLIKSYINKGFQPCIITNSHSDWFKTISMSHLPKFFDFAQQNNLHVVSARDNYADLYTDCTKWKMLAFQSYVFDRVLPNRDPFSSESCILQYRDVYVLSIGDSQLDVIATSELRKSQLGKLVNITTKFIKYEDSPHIDLVIKQLRYTIENTDFLDSISQSGTIDMNTNNPVTNEQYLASKGFTKQSLLLGGLNNTGLVFENSKRDPFGSTSIEYTADNEESDSLFFSFQSEGLINDINITDPGEMEPVFNFSDNEFSTIFQPPNVVDIPQSPPVPLESMQIFFTNPAKII